MESLSALRRRMGAVTSLGHLVKNLKVISAVNIRHFERATAASQAYQENIERGLQVVMRNVPEALMGFPDNGRHMVLFGTDTGLCGSFNHQLAGFAAPLVAATEARVVCVGARLREALEEQDLEPQKYLDAPTSTASILSCSLELLQALKPLGGQLTLIYQRYESNGAHQPFAESILPIEMSWLKELRLRPWTSRSLPQNWGQPQMTLQWLLEEHLMVACQRAFCHSLVSENQARLVTMQSAERNLGELGETLRGDFNNARQNAVTEELLDVISSFEMLKGSR